MWSEPAAKTAVTKEHTVLVLGALLGVLLGVSVTFRGLYFPAQQLAAVAVACAVAAAVAVAGRRPGPLLRHRLDWLALGVSASYLLSLFVAVHPSAAIHSWLVHTMDLLVFWAAAELALRSDAARQAILHGLLLGGLITAATGLLGAAGVQGHGWFVTDRIFTSIQYPDGAAAYLAAVAFLALGLRLRSGQPRLQFAYAGLAAILLFTFVFALSRGAALVFLPVALLFALMQERTRRLEAAGSILLALLAVAVGSVPYVLGLKAAHLRHAPGAGPVLTAVALTIATALALEWMRQWLATRGSHLNRFIPLGLRILGAVALAGAVTIAIGFHHSALTRLGRISLHSYSAWSRIRWWLDGLRMVAIRPILGWGGGGWTAAYHAFQSYDYSSTQVHSGWVQTWVNTGSVGFLLWCAFWVLLLLTTLTALRRASRDQRPVLAGLAGLVAMIGGHAFLDFTLSLQSISVAMWAASGMLRSAAMPPATAPAPARPRQRHAPSPREFWTQISVGTVMVALITFSLVQLTAIVHLDAAARLARQPNQLPASQVQLHRALVDDPWSSAVAYDLAQVDETMANQLMSGGKQSPTVVQGYLQRANNWYRNAVALDSYDAARRTAYAQFLGTVGQDPQAVRELQSALADAPYSLAQYSALSTGLIEAAIQAAHGHHTKSAATYLSDLASVAGSLKSHSAAIPPRALAESKALPSVVPPFPATDPGLQLSAAEASALKGHWTTTARALKPLTAVSGSLGGEANLWLGVVEQHTKSAGAKTHLAAAQKLLGAQYAAQLKLVQGAVGTLG